MALGLLLGTDRGLLDHPGLRFLQKTLATEELTTIPAMVDRGINSPLTSSMGRLFDAVAAIAGVRADAAYEGQAAIELEALADRSEAGAYPFGLNGEGPVVIDPEPMLRALLDDLAAGVSAPTVSARFHNGVVAASVEVARRACALTGATRVACAGGVFMNRIVLARIVAGVEAAGLTPLTHRDLPATDGGISFGQTVVAHARRDEV